ncbi:hypothetical protein bcgnr5379_63530 [Bacillus cereus]
MAGVRSTTTAALGGADGGRFGSAAIFAMSFGVLAALVLAEAGLTKLRSFLAFLDLLRLP